jgi:hypothetical protein
VRELTDPAYGAVHHLTVAAYMLQHSSKLSRQGWLETRRILRAFLVGNQSPAEIRKQDGRRVEAGQRDWKIASPDGNPVIRKSAWSKTILYIRLDSSQAYCADVAAWASAVLAEAEQLEPEPPEGGWRGDR